MTPSPSAPASPSEADLRAIARGDQPEPFTYTATHALHGELTFTAGLPRAVAINAHYVAIDNLLAELHPATEPSIQTRIFAAALAGMTPPDPERAGEGLLMRLPEIGREKVAGDDDGVHERWAISYYDPHAETDPNFITDVWLAFSAWRGAFLNPKVVERLGEASGGTSGSASSATSTEPGVSPPAIPA